jgi:hypothetical protein
MGALLRTFLFYGPGRRHPGGAYRRQASLDLVTAGFFEHFGETIPRFRTTYALPLPQHIVVEDIMGTKSSKGESAKQENFLKSFFGVDSGICEGILHKD